MKGKKRLRIITSALFFAALAAVIVTWWAPGRSEPVYQGKPLSYWLSGFAVPILGLDDSPYPYLERPSLTETSNAMKHLGTNAFPAIASMIEAKDSKLKIKVITWLNRQPWVKHKFHLASGQYWVAAAAFSRFPRDGAGMSSAETELLVTRLTRVYERRDGTSKQRVCALSALGGIGPAAASAVPCMARALSHETNSEARMNAALALTKIHTQPAIAVPALINALSDPNREICVQAAEALGAYGPEANSAVLVLRYLANQLPAGESEVGQRHVYTYPEPVRLGIAAKRALARIEALAPPETNDALWFLTGK